MYIDRLPRIDVSEPEIHKPDRGSRQMPGAQSYSSAYLGKLSKAFRAGKELRYVAVDWLSNDCSVLEEELEKASGGRYYPRP